MSLVDLHVHVSPEIGRLDLLKLDETLTNLRFIWARQHSTENVCTSVKNIPLAFLFTLYWRLLITNNCHIFQIFNISWYLHSTCRQEEPLGMPLWISQPQSLIEIQHFLISILIGWEIQGISKMSTISKAKFLSKGLFNFRSKLKSIGSRNYSTEDGGIIVPVSEVTSFIERCMTTAGTRPAHAKTLADNLTAADHRGHFSHGLNRLGRLYILHFTHTYFSPAPNWLFLQQYCKSVARVS